MQRAGLIYRRRRSAHHRGDGALRHLQRQPFQHRAEPAIRRAVTFMQVINSDHVTFSSTDAAVRASRR